MSDLLQIIAAYVPPSIVHTTLADRAPTPPTAARAEQIEGAILFADVSGFTPLTEALAKKSAEGPEELTRLLNGYFSRMITLVEAEGGEVVKFSGDAVTVVFQVRRRETLGCAVRRARQAAEAMQGAMDEFRTLQTGAGVVALAMKIGIGAGAILAAHVGGIFDRWEYVIAGDPLRQVAEAEDKAEQDDIILSPEAEALIYPHALPPAPLPEPDWSRVYHPDQVETVLRCYVPGAVTTWLRQGKLQDWLAVLRPMSVLFIGVGGLDYTQPETVDRLHTFFRSVQEIIYHYEGSINKLAVDDKGTIAIILLGAPPFAHENDPERALRCALDLQEMAGGHKLQLAIGLTTGRVFAGPVGGQTRREYTVMGDTVNIAARLMQAAGPGEIRCDQETYRLTRSRLNFDELPPIRLKGKTGFTPVYRPLRRLDHQANETPETRGLVGRRAEMAQLKAGLAEVKGGRSRILVVEGEAGIGKSRLVEEVMRLAGEGGVASLLGMGRSIEQQTPYRAWCDIFTAYFGLDDIESPQERQQCVYRQVEAMTPNLVERIPLLNDILNLGFPENELTAFLDASVRHNSLVSLLLALLLARAGESPLLIVLEDAHWLDAISWDLTLQVARTLTILRAPLFLALAMRPLRRKVRRPQLEALLEMDEVEKISLDSMAPEEIVALAAARLGLDARRLPVVVVNLVRDRAGGNPFFAEELIYTLRDKGLITVTADDEQTICRVSGDLDEAVQTLPDTIQGIVLSRIDRLPPEEQLALKVATVIGRTFAYVTLYETLDQHTDISRQILKIYLDDLERLDFTPVETPEPELTYIFKHIITQEVAYKTLLFAQRRRLHQTVAAWYERKFGAGDTEPPPAGLAPVKETPLTPVYPLLVYHWRQADRPKREQHYAWLAGQRASAQFANADAENYFNRALELTPTSDYPVQYQLLRARESVHDLSGNREAQAQDLAALALLAEVTSDKQWQAETALRKANFAEVVSDYPASLAAAQQAVEYARQIDDQALEVEGYIAWGRALWRKGDYDAAREVLAQALDAARLTRNHFGEAKSLYYLGYVYLYQNNHPVAQKHCQQALALHRSLGQRQSEADSLTILGTINYELGDLSAARDDYEQVLAIFHNIGDRRGEAMMLNNLGNVYCDLGDYETARTYQEQALDLYQTLGDRWGEALSSTNLGLIHGNLGNYETARRQCNQALTIQREIGDRRTRGYSLTYLGHALVGLGDLEAAAATYNEAIILRREMGQDSLAIDDLAGLARVTLAQNNPNQALTHMEEILAWLEENGPNGIEYPLQVYLTCYQVLSSSAAGRHEHTQKIQTILTTAHTALMDQAAGISNEALRQSFLENVSANRKILAAWQTHHLHDA